MRVLVISDLFPPVAFGGYERECASVVAHLRRSHEVLVLTSDMRAAEQPPEAGVLRELPYLGGHRMREVLRGPVVARRAAVVTRRVLDEFVPDLVFVWEMVLVPQAAIAVVAERGLPLAYRLCVRWAARVFTGDRYMRELAEDHHGVRGLWSYVARAANELPGMKLEARVPHRAALSWASDALRAASTLSPAVHPVLDRTIWPATEQGDAFALFPREPSPDPTVALVGRIDPEKGSDVAVRALAVLHAEHGIPARLKVAGASTEPMQRALAALARSLGVNDSIDWLGRPEKEELGRIMGSAQVLVLPSRWDAFPLVLREAAFARVPVVASDVGGVPESLPDEEYSLLFPPGDHVACAAALARALSDREGSEARAARAFERAQVLFTTERYLEETDRFLADAQAVFAGRSPVPVLPAVDARSPSRA